MDKATGFFNLLHNYVVGAFFLGMLAIAGVAIFSLSPIDYETYAAAKKTRDAANAQLDARVAGVSDFAEGAAAQGLQVRQLLERKGVGYAFSAAEGRYQLSLDSASLLNSKLDRLELVDIVNNSVQTKELNIQLSNYEQSNGFGVYKYNLLSGSVALTTVKSDNPSVQKFKLKLVGGDATSLIVTRSLVADFAPASFLPAKNLELSLQGS